MRAESEQTRAEYRTKLARLQERRDKLFGDMRRELDDSFRDAHSEVAHIIAELQRQPSSQRAATARTQLETLRDRTAQSQADRGIEPTAPSAEPTPNPIDWPRARVGDAVQAPGGGVGTILSLPDRKGRVMVQVAGAKLTISRDQLGSATREPNVRTPSNSSNPLETTSAPPLRIGGTAETDLRGLRVDEALDRLDIALDLAAAEGRDEILIIHGIGTGALRSAVREHLPRSHYVVEWVETIREDGGAGATRGILRKD
jgi:DNA mismatch repair protein MutS2